MSKDVEKARARIVELKRELRTLKGGNATVPKAVAFARIDEEISGQAAEGHRFVSSWCERQRLGDSGANNLFDTPRLLAPMLIALMPEVMRASLRAEVERQYGGTDDGIDPAQIPARIATLEAELLTAERRDFDASQKAGIPPRPDTDARVLLGL